MEWPKTLNELTGIKNLTKIIAQNLKYILITHGAPSNVGLFIMLHVKVSYSKLVTDGNCFSDNLN